MNKNILFVSANTIKFQPSFFISEGIYISTDRGVSWFGSDTCKGNNIQYHGGDPGITITSDGTFIITRLGRIPFTGLFSHYSTNNGLTWSNQQAVTGDNLERAVTKTDNSPISPFYGRTYTAWIRYTSPYPMVFSYTDNIKDTGQVWAAPRQINSPTQRGAGGDIAIDINGNVFICWAAVANSSPFNELFVGFASSSDGGNNWNVNENIFNVNGIQGVLSNKQNIRVNGLPKIAVDNSGGSYHGRIYIVTTQKNLSPAGSDPDVILSYSDDKGLSWAQPVRVNQDMINNNKTQFFPAIHVDNHGGVHIIYYDDRYTTNDSAGVVLSYSDDGGLTWRDYQISDHNFRPEPIGGLGQGYQGDNIDLTSSGDKIFPVWMDNSSGIYQLWTGPYDLSTINIKEQNELILDFILEQNYPNPFNPTTTIAYQIPRDGLVTLKVYDILGREVTTLVNEVKTAGKYEVKLNVEQSAISGFSLSSGIYFYELNAAGNRIIKKLVLLK